MSYELNQSCAMHAVSFRFTSVLERCIFISELRNYPTLTLNNIKCNIVKKIILFVVTELCLLMHVLFY